MSDETALYLRVRGDVVRVDGRSAVLGRSKSCDVQLDVQGVSRRHCEVLLRDDGAFVRDLGSTHGTWVDGRRVAGEDRVPAGAMVRLGAHGPHFELVNAIVRGRPVLGGGAPPAHVAEPSDRTTQAIPTLPPPPAPEPSPANGSTGWFVAGLLWGVVGGLVAGTLVLAFVNVPI